MNGYLLFDELLCGISFKPCFFSKNVKSRLPLCTKNASDNVNKILVVDDEKDIVDLIKKLYAKIPRQPERH